MAAGCTTIQFDEIQTYISHGHLPSKTIPSPFFAARCYANAACAVMRCLSVCLSVCPSITFVDSVETNKCIFKTFSPSDSQTIVVFQCQTSWRYSDVNLPNGGSLGRQKSRFPTSIGLHGVLSTLRTSGAINTAPPDCGML